MVKRGFLVLIVLLFSFSLVSALPDDTPEDCSGDWTPYYFGGATPYCCGNLGDEISRSDFYADLGKPSGLYDSVCCESLGAGETYYVSAFSDRKNFLLSSLNIPSSSRSDIVFYKDKLYVKVIAPPNNVDPPIVGTQAFLRTSSGVNRIGDSSNDGKFTWGAYFPMDVWSASTDDYLVFGGQTNLPTAVSFVYPIGGGVPFDLNDWRAGYFNLGSNCLGDPGDYESAVISQLVTVDNLLFVSYHNSRDYVGSPEAWFGSGICVYDISSVDGHLNAGANIDLGASNLASFKLLFDENSDGYNPNTGVTNDLKYYDMAIRKASSAEGTDYVLYVLKEDLQNLGAKVSKYHVDYSGSGAVTITPENTRSLDVSVEGGLEIDKNGYVYVADTGGDRVLILDKNLNDVDIVEGLTGAADLYAWGNYLFYIYETKDGPVYRYNAHSCEIVPPPALFCSAAGQQLFDDFSYFPDNLPFDINYDPLCCGDNASEQNATFDYYAATSVWPDGWISSGSPAPGHLEQANFDFQTDPCLNSTSDITCVDNTNVCCRQDGGEDNCVWRDQCYARGEAISLASGFPAVCYEGLINGLMQWYDPDTDKTTCEFVNYDWSYQGVDANFGEYTTSNLDRYEDRIAGDDDFWNSLLPAYLAGLTYDDPIAISLALNETRSCCGDDPGEQVFVASDGQPVCCPANQYTGVDIDPASDYKYVCTGAPAGVCDNDGVKEVGEECDGNDLNGQSCESLGYLSGDLSCNADCTFNADDCVDIEPGPVAGLNDYIVYGDCVDDGNGDSFGIVTWTRYDETGAPIGGEDASGNAACVLDVEEISFFDYSSVLIFLLVLVLFYIYRKKY